MVIFNDHLPRLLSQALTETDQVYRSDTTDVGRCRGAFPVVRRTTRVRVSTPPLPLSFAGVAAAIGMQILPSQGGNAEMRLRRGVFTVLRAISIKMRDSVIECRRLIVPPPAARKSPF